MKKLLVILIFGFSLLHALSYDEMLEQEYIKPSSVDCESEKVAIDFNYLCWPTPTLPHSQQFSAIKDNFYSSYYKFIKARLDTEDKKEFEKLSKEIIEDRRASLKEARENYNNLDLPENANPTIFDMYMIDTLDEVYLQYFKKITNFIYDNPKYKYIFDEIFAPNPKEYYELIKSDKEFLLSKIIDKAAKDNLIDKTGKLIKSYE